MNTSFKRLVHIHIVLEKETGTHHTYLKRENENENLDRKST
jgi:hypothetical protein